MLGKKIAQNAITVFRTCGPVLPNVLLMRGIPSTSVFGEVICKIGCPLLVLTPWLCSHCLVEH
eukprot:6491694-Amphidinium_carterae.1